MVLTEEDYRVLRKNFIDNKREAFKAAAEENLKNVINNENNILEKRIKIFQKNANNPEPKPDNEDINAYKKLLNPAEKNLNSAEKEIISRDVARKMAIDPKKQTFDQKFIYNKIEGEKNEKLEDKGKVFNKQGKLVISTDGKIIKKGEGAQDTSIKTSDAYLQIDGKTRVFCTFKSTFTNGGSQDHQAAEAAAVAKIIKKTERILSIAVLDGDYYFDEHNFLRKSFLQKYNLKYEYFNYGGVEFCNIMHASAFVEKVRDLVKKTNEDMEKKANKVNNTLTEDLIMEEEINDAQILLNSLNNIEIAMRQQNMNVSVLQKIKQKFAIFFNNLKKIGGKIKQNFSALRNRIKTS